MHTFFNPNAPFPTWQQFLARPDNKGLNVMQAKQKYLNEQANYYRMIPPTPSFASAAAGAGSNAPEPFTNNFSMNFDGTNDKIFVGESLNVSLGITEAISFSAWVKFPLNYNGGANPRKATIIGEDDVGGNLRNFSFGFRGGSTRGIETYVFNTDGTQIYIKSSTTVNDNNWHHVAAAYDGTAGEDTFKLYIDGVNTDSTGSSSTGVRSTSTVGTIVGSLRDSSPLYPLQADLDELAVFDKGLTSEEVTTIYNGGVPGDISSLNPFLWYRFEEGSGTTVIDHGSGGNNGTIDGATYSTDLPGSG